MHHIKKHGNDVATEIIGTYSLLSDLVKAGLYYSKLWDIVESKQWANIIAEQGEGGSYWLGKKRGPQSPEWLKNRVAAMKGIKHPNYKPRTKEQNDHHSQMLAETWEIITPNNETKIIKSLNKYCKENNLIRSCMQRVNWGIYKQHRGYKCRKIEHV